MTRVTPYLPQVGVADANSGRRADVSDFGGTGVASARLAAEFGETLTGIGDALEKRRREKEAFAVQSALAKEKTDLLLWYRDMEKAAPEGGVDFTGLIKGKLEERQKILQKQFAGYSPEAQRALALQLPDVHRGYLGDAIRFEAAASGAQMKREVETGVGGFLNATTLEPHRLPEFIQGARRLVSAIPHLGNEQKAEYMFSIERDMHKAALEGWVQQAGASGDPDEQEDLLNQIRSDERWRRNVDPASFQRIVHGLDDGIVKARKTNGDDALRIVVEGAESAWMQGRDAQLGNRAVGREEVEAGIMSLTGISPARKEKALADLHSAYQIKEVRQALDRGDILAVVDELEDVRELEGQVMHDQGRVAEFVRGINGTLAKDYDGNVDQLISDIKEGHAPADSVMSFFNSMRRIFPESIVLGSEKTKELFKEMTRTEFHRELEGRAPEDLVEMQQAFRTGRAAAEMGLADHHSANATTRLLSEGVIRKGAPAEGEIRFSQYAGPSDRTRDTLTDKGLGNRGNTLRRSSVALSRDLIRNNGLQGGEGVYIVKPDGSRELVGYYDDSTAATTKSGDPITNRVDVYDLNDQLGEDDFSGVLAPGARIEFDRSTTAAGFADTAYRLTEVTKEITSRAERMKEVLDQRIEEVKKNGASWLGGDLLGDITKAEPVFRAAGKHKEILDRRASALKALEGFSMEYWKKPADFLIAADQGVTGDAPAALNRWSQAIGTPAAPREFERYVGALEQAAGMRRLNPGRFKHALLPEAAVESIKDLYAQATPEDPESAVAVTAQVQAAVGDHWPVVAKQLMGDVLPPARAFYALGDMNSGPFRQIAAQIERTTQGENPDELMKRLKLTPQEMDDVLTEVSGKFYTTFARDPYQPEIGRALFDGLKQAAMGVMKDGPMTGVEGFRVAAQRLFDKTISSQYSMREGDKYQFLRIPSAWNRETVFEGMDLAIQGITKDGVWDTPEAREEMKGASGYERKAAIFDAFRANPRWVLSEDQRGVYLYDNAMDPVMVGQNKQYYVSFQELHDNGAKSLATTEKRLERYQRDVKTGGPGRSTR